MASGRTQSAPRPSGPEQPLVRREGVRVGPERARVDRDGADGLGAVDGHQGAHGARRAGRPRHVEHRPGGPRDVRERHETGPRPRDLGDRALEVAPGPLGADHPQPGPRAAGHHRQGHRQARVLEGRS